MSAPELTDEVLDDLHANALDTAQRTLRATGMLFAVIHCYSRDGKQYLIMESGDGDAPSMSEEGFLLLPGPLRSWTVALQQIMEKFDVIAATLVGEGWAFPHGREEECYRAFMDGQGPGPSDHPERQELLFAITAYPLGGYFRTQSFFMVRGEVEDEPPAKVAAFVDGEDLRVTSEDKEHAGRVESWLVDLLPKGE